MFVGLKGGCFFEVFKGFLGEIIVAYPLHKDFDLLISTSGLISNSLNPLDSVFRGSVDVDKGGGSGF